MDARQLAPHIPGLRRYARALTGNAWAADDLVQDTMERGWHKLASWRRGGDMRAWLFGIMHNLHVDRQRQPSLHTVELSEELQGSLSAPAAGDRLEIRDMQAALQLLPAEQREVLLLVALEDMSYEEVA
eukprot:gene27460-31038_t